MPVVQVVRPGVTDISRSRIVDMSSSAAPKWLVSSRYRAITLNHLLASHSLGLFVSFDQDRLDRFPLPGFVLGRAQFL
jgi:hypothetical protein